MSVEKLFVIIKRLVTVIFTLAYIKSLDIVNLSVTKRQNLVPYILFHRTMLVISLITDVIVI